MKDRITQFLISENISPAEFADKIGVQRSSVSHVLNGRNYPGASFIQKMLSLYSNLNPRWLLLGEGNMLEASNRNRKESSLFEDQTQGIPDKGNSSVPIGKTEKSALFYRQDTQEKKLETMTSQTSGPADLTRDFREMIGKNIDNKDIESIVLFFKDKTFTSYTPSK